MATFSQTTNITFTGSLASNTDLSQVKEVINLRKQINLANGTSSGQANEHWSDQRTLAAASEGLDIQDGSLTNAVGDAVALTSLKELFIENLSTTTTENLLVSGNALPTNAAATTVTIPPGGNWHWSSPIDGHTITGGSADTITVDAGSDTITYKIKIVGLT